MQLQFITFQNSECFIKEKMTNVPLLSKVFNVIVLILIRL